MGDEIISLLAGWAQTAFETFGAREIGLAALAAVFATTFFVALRQFRFFSELRDVEGFIDKAIRRSRVRVGPKPKHKDAVEHRRQRIRDVVDETWRLLWQRFWLFAATGLFFPCALLFAIAVNYDTLHPGAVAFADPAQGILLSTLPPADAAVLVLDQFMRGALLDFMEVYRLDVAPVTHNSADWMFSSLLIFFRALTGLFTGALAFFLFQFLRTRFSNTFKTMLHAKVEKETTA